MSAGPTSFCPSCGAGLPPGAAFCPGCGAQLDWGADEPYRSPLARIARPGRRTSIILTVVLGIGVWSAYANGLFGGSIQEQADQTMANIQAKVAADAVKQYEIASRSGHKPDKCVQAGLVAAAYLQAQDQINYALWKQTEGFDCAAAGLPGM